VTFAWILSKYSCLGALTIEFYREPSHGWWDFSMVKICAITFFLFCQITLQNCALICAWWHAIRHSKCHNIRHAKMGIYVLYGITPGIVAGMPSARFWSAKWHCLVACHQKHQKMACQNVCQMATCVSRGQIRNDLRKEIIFWIHYILLTS